MSSSNPERHPWPGGSRSGPENRVSAGHTRCTEYGVGRRSGNANAVARQRSAPALARLVAAIALGLDRRLSEPSATGPASGTLGQRVQAHRVELQEVSSRHGLSNARVSGSVARGEDGDGGDVDLPADILRGVGLVTVGPCQAELEERLGATVDLVPTGDLKPGVATEALAGAVARCVAGSVDASKTPSPPSTPTSRAGTCVTGSSSTLCKIA